MSEEKLISSESEIALPDSFVCPICGKPLYIEEVSEHEKDDDGNWKAVAVKVDCVSFPGFGNAEAFEDYIRSHYSTPYTDWLPLEKRVTAWVNARYSWSL